MIKQKNSNAKVFIIIMLLIFFIGTLLGALFGLESSMNKSRITIDKTKIISIKGDFNNRLLQKNSSNNMIFTYEFDNSKFKETNLNDWWLVTEKIDAQYLEVYLNEELIGRKGQREGNSNLWNATFFFDFDRKDIHEQNTITFKTNSSYMSGANGEIYFIPKKLSTNQFIINTLVDNLTHATIQIILFTSLMIVLMIIGLKLDRHTSIAYFYFLISLVALGYSMIDFIVSEHLFVDYLTYKKTILFAYFIASTFSCVSVAQFLNSKLRINFGHLGLFLIAIASIVSHNMIDFRNYYSIINLLLPINTLFTLFIIIINLKKERNKASILLIGYGLTFVSVLKLVVSTSMSLPIDFRIDLPILMLVFVIMLMYLMLEEYWLFNSQLTFQNVELNQEKSLLYDNLGQGFCYLGSNGKVTGQYSKMCDKIFGYTILGTSLGYLFAANDQDESNFIDNTLLELISCDEITREAYITLLPESINIGKRILVVHYLFVEHSIDQPIMVVFSDVTYIRELEGQMKNANEKVTMLINIFKNRNEIKYLIEEVDDLYVELNACEVVNQSIRLLMHTLKGNLGQYGFKNTELVIHNLETDLTLHPMTSSKKIATLIQQSFEQEYQSILAYTGQSVFELDEKIELHNKELELIENIIHSDDLSQNKLNKVQTIVTKMRQINLKLLIKRYDHLVINLSQKLNKVPTQLVIEGEDILVNPHRIERLIQSFVGLFRNCVYHGIENESQRIASGKQLEALIACQIAMKMDTLIITIEDDGCGMSDKNEPIEDGELSHKNDPELINLYAGRGLGLMALQNMIENYHGQLVIESQKDVGTRFIISIPYKWVE